MAFGIGITLADFQIVGTKPSRMDALNIVHTGWANYRSVEIFNENLLVKIGRHSRTIQVMKNTQSEMKFAILCRVTCLIIIQPAKYCLYVCIVRQSRVVKE